QSAGTLWGRVSDPNGGAIHDVLLTVRNRSIGYKRTTKTDQDGLYQVAGLPTGDYQMEVRAPGFPVQVIDEIPIDPGRTAVRDFQLEIEIVSRLSQIRSPPPLDTILTGLDLDGDGISRTLLPGTSHNSLGFRLSTAGLRALVAAYNADVEGRTHRITNTDGSVTVIRPRTPFNQIINPIALPTVFSNGDSFVSQDLRLTRQIALKESFTLSLIAEAFNVFNIANLTGYSSVLNQPNYGQPSARVGQVFGTGGPRAFQFGARLTF